MSYYEEETQTTEMTYDSENFNVSRPTSYSATEDFSSSIFVPADWLWDWVTWSWWEILQTVFAALGLVGNLLVMTVLIQRRSTRRSADTLIGALAAADFLTSLFMIPHPTPRKVPETFFGNVVCKIVRSSAFMWVSSSASIFTLTAISIERFIAVVYPLKAKLFLTRNRTVMGILIIWVCSLICVSPEFVFHIVQPGTGSCIFQYQSTIAQEVYGIFVISAFFFIPSFVMLFVHIVIVITLQRQTLRFHNDQRTDHSSPSYKILLMKKRATKLLFIIVVMYVICWAPNTFAYLAVSLNWLNASFVYSPPYEGLVALAFFNSCVNPIIYSIQCPGFRKALKEILSPASISVTRSPLFADDIDGSVQGSVP